MVSDSETWDIPRDSDQSKLEMEDTDDGESDLELGDFQALLS